MSHDFADEMSEVAGRRDGVFVPYNYACVGSAGDPEERCWATSHGSGSAVPPTVYVGGFGEGLPQEKG